MSLQVIVRQFIHRSAKSSSGKRNYNYLMRHLPPLVGGVAGQHGLKLSRPLSQVGPGSTRPESTGPCIFSERSVTYVYMYMIYGLGSA